MAISKVGSTVPTVAVAAAATITPAWAGDMPRTAGNLLILRVGANVAITTPTGWSATGGASQSAGGQATFTNIFYKIAAGSDAAPTVAASGAAHMTASLEEFTGNSSTPYQSSADGAATAVSGTTLTPTSGAAPTVGGGVSITSVYAHFASASVVTETPPSSPLTYWHSGGFDAANQSTHGGGDYHIAPPSSAADSELITLGTAPDAWAACIAYFAPASGSWGLVQAVGGNNVSGGASTVVATTTVAVTTGNKIIVSVQFNSLGAITVGSVTDNAGNTYTKDAGNEDATNHAGVHVWSAQVVSGGGSTLTVTAHVGTGAVAQIGVAEYAGLTTSTGSSSLDGTATANGTATTTPSSGASGTTTAANELVIGAIGQDTDRTSATPGATEGLAVARLAAVGNTSALTMLQKDSGASGTTQTSNGTFAAAKNWTVVEVVYKLPGGAAAAPPTPIRRIQQAVGRAANY